MPFTVSIPDFGIPHSIPPPLLTSVDADPLLFFDSSHPDLS